MCAQDNTYQHQTTAPGIVFVVGMASEKRIVASLGRVLVGTADLASALRERPAGVISFGMCGGLDPALLVGDLLIADGVVTGGRRIAACAAWNDALGAGLPKARRGDIAAGDAIVGSVDAKAALWRTTGAACVDMESHQVALAAEAVDIPFAVVRAVSDPATRALPPSALAGFKIGPTADGESDVDAVLRALARRPWELPALIQTAMDSAKAIRSLRRAAKALTKRPP